MAEVLARPNVTGWLRLQDLASATTVRADSATGVPLLIDGPFVDTKDYLGGLIVVEAEVLDGAQVVLEAVAAATLADELAFDLAQVQGDRSAPQGSRFSNGIEVKCARWISAGVGEPTSPTRVMYSARSNRCRSGAEAVIRRLATPVTPIVTQEPRHGRCNGRSPTEMTFDAQRDSRRPANGVSGRNAQRTGAATARSHPAWPDGYRTPSNQ